MLTEEEKEDIKTQIMNFEFENNKEYHQIDIIHFKEEEDQYVCKIDTWVNDSKEEHRDCIYSKEQFQTKTEKNLANKAW